VLSGDPAHGIDYFFIVHCSCHGGSIPREGGRGIRQAALLWGIELTSDLRYYFLKIAVEPFDR
jgi:hypothetical protein